MQSANRVEVSIVYHLFLTLASASFFSALINGTAVQAALQNVSEFFFAVVGKIQSKY
jgi:hypothetical protein